MPVCVSARPNIALVKYWGKQDSSDNVPATPSLSITLSELETQTTVSIRDDNRHVIRLNEQVVRDAKIENWLQRLARSFDIPPLSIDTANTFPTGAGLASSASGFAALITAVDQLCSLNLSAAELSRWARMGSGSAARSMLGGFVALRAPHWTAEPVLDRQAWPLRVVIAVTTHDRKAVSSTTGMRLSATTSPYYAAWAQQTEKDFGEAHDAVREKDFEALSRIAESSCLNMHALMMSTQPALIYWNGVTVECIHRVRALRETGVAVFFTIDAGAQVKAVCLPEHANRVAAELAEITGVQQVFNVGLGDAPTILSAPASLP